MKKLTIYFEDECLADAVMLMDDAKKFGLSIMEDCGKKSFVALNSRLIRDLYAVLSSSQDKRPKHK